MSCPYNNSIEAITDMSLVYPLVPLGNILIPVSRPEIVEPQVKYNLLGAHWYAEGLYTKEIKSGSQIQAKLLYKVEKGDFVYNRLFAWKGSFAIATEKNDGCYVSNEFPCFTLNLNKIDSQYLWRYFSRTSAWDEALSLSSGGTPTSRNRLKEEKLLSLEIPLPPLEEQRRIVARVEELVGKIEEARSLRKQSLEEVEALISSEAGRVFYLLSKKYKLRSFGNFNAHVTSGPRNWSTKYADTGLRFYRAQDIGLNGKLLHNSKMFITPPDSSQGSSARLITGDLMIVITGATVGRCTVFPSTSEPGYVNQHVAICRLTSVEVNPYFALWALLSPFGQEQLLKQRYGQGKPGLNLTNIRAIQLPFPPLLEQRRIVSYLDELQAKIDIMKRMREEAMKELHALLPSILDKAFKGEL